MDESSKITAIRQQIVEDAAQDSLKTLAHYVALNPALAEEIDSTYASCMGTTVTKEGAQAHRRANGRELIGSTVGDGRYRITERLGAGGQATVFLATDLTLGRRVALKIFPATGLISARQQERVRREGQIASRLEHPGICAVHDTGEDHGFTYLVMRHVEGKTLSALIRQRVEAGSKTTQSLFYGFEDEPENLQETVALPLPQPEPNGAAPTLAKARSRNAAKETDEILRLVAGAARALHAAHEAGIIHRDVKPNNIMVTPTLDPVILDFGMARDDDSEVAELTLSGEVFGTPSYMSPEQISGRRGLVDRRTDVYALGVTLYECLTLHRPFAAATREHLFEQILQREAIDPRHFNPAISRDLAVVLATAMTKEPDRRYQTALDLALEIERVLAGHPIKARPIGPIGRFQRWFRRNPALAGSATAAFIILITATFVTWNMAIEAQADRDRADARTREYEGLADARRLSDLVGEARDELRPIGTTQVEAMRSWLARARMLLARLPEHERHLAELRRRGRRLIRSEPTRPNEEPAAVRLGAGESIVPGERIVSTGRSPSASDLEEDDATWVFARPEDAWYHDQLASLVRELGQLGTDDDKAITIGAIARRLSLAETLRARSVETQAQAWADAGERIRKSPLYDGLDLLPQIGLLPLGPNAGGYEEFRHLLSADPKGQGGIILVLLPGGSGIELGSPSDEPGRRSDEFPHRVDLAPFFMAKHEVTRASWQNLVAAGLGLELRPLSPGELEVADLPVASLSAEDCDRFVALCGLQLPGEDQWEYACRGGTRSAYWWGDDESMAADLANVGSAQFEADSLSRGAWPVNQGGANRFGLLGLHGNLAEWCADDYEPRRTGGTEEARAAAPERSYRDGSFILPVVFGRSAARHKADPGVRVKTFGFRPMRPLD